MAKLGGKRNKITLQQKKEMIDKVVEGLAQNKSFRRVGIELQVHHATLASIWSQRDKIINYIKASPDTQASVSL